MANVTIGWAELWSWLKGMPIEGLRAIGQELNGEDFTRWIHMKSPKVQEEILEAAPVEFQQYLYSRNLISPYVVNRLGIRPSNRTAIVDNRTKRLSR